MQSRLGTEAGSSLFQNKKKARWGRSATATAMAAGILASGGIVGLTTAPVAMAADENMSCSANFLIEQDLTFSFSEADLSQTKAQLSAAVKSFNGSVVDATAGISSFGWVSPVTTGPTLTGERIDTAAGNTALVNQIAKYELHRPTSGFSNSERTNWQEGLTGALRNAKNQGAKTIIFVTDGVPNTYDGDPGGAWGSEYSPKAAAAAKVKAAEIRAAGITLVPVFIKTSEPGRGGINDPITPTPASTIQSAMRNLDPNWTIGNAVDIASLSAKIMKEATASCAPGISLEKTHATPVDVNGNGHTDRGDTVVFNFLTKNTGDLPLSNVTVTDPKLAAAGVTLVNGGKIGALGTGKSTTISSNPYTITQADVDAGVFLNVATVTGESPKGNPKDTDDDKVPVTGAPAISLDKSHKDTDIVDVNGNGLTDAGDTVVFTLLSTNTGTLTLKDVTVTDPILEAAGVKLVDGGKIGTMAPGAKATVKSEPYTITQADVDAGEFLNVATVTGTNPLDPKTPVTDEDDDLVPTQPKPGISLDKSHQDTDIVDVNGNGKTDLGDRVFFTLVTENTGNITLKDVTVTDQKLADAGVKLEKDGKAGDLAPGAKATVKSEPYTITQADVDAGEFLNVATVTGTNPLDPKTPVTDEDDDIVPVEKPAPVVEKFIAATGGEIETASSSSNTPLVLALGAGGVLLAGGASLAFIRRRKNTTDATD